MRIQAATVIIAFTLAAPVQAGIVFSDNFNAENGGLSGLNYNGFANFSVIGAVDIIRNGDFGLLAAGGSGSAVDLAGTPGPGRLISLASFAFNVGDQVRLSYDLSGNQRGGSDDLWSSGFSFSGSVQLINFGFNFFGSDFVVGNFSASGISSSTGISSSAPYATRSIFFTAGTSGILQFSIDTTGVDDFGPMLDNVSLDIEPANSVPEPTSIAMWGLGAIGLVFARRKRQQMKLAA